DLTLWQMNGGDWYAGSKVRQRDDADRLLALPHWAVRPAPDAPVLFSLEHLRVKSGDRIAIVGRNGCGKSSLL
ncbi:ATP-binding cassette domain-containing protein, partial [Klebsiella aerogenes]|uniref:ATP-binding cassette domain-containing protein n=1 Tax=Klebsiella aerogenes TaxID=548 RepID=UPI000E2F603A